MVRAIHSHRHRPYDATEETAGCDGDGMTQTYRRSPLPVLKRFRDLGWDVLKQTAAAGNVHGLHASADAEQRDIRLFRQVDNVQFKTCTTFAYEFEWIALSFAIQRRWKIRPASGEEESVDMFQEALSRGSVCEEWQHQRDAPELFDRTNIAPA